MFELTDFYRYCREHHIDVIPFDRCPQPAATVRDQGVYAVFLNFSQIPSSRFLRGVCYHELGHLATGALHKVDSPHERVARSECRAIGWSARVYLTQERFREAFAAGYTELWQLAEYFDLPEQDIQAALSYWTEQKGIDFNKK